MSNFFVPIMRGKTVVVGIGNPLRGDDGLGPALIARLHPTGNLICIDAGSAPENYAGRIAKEAPDTILLVDATHLGIEPGQYRLLKPADISAQGFTTHDMSSRMLIDFLSSQTRADIYMLAVQPQQVVLGEPVSACITHSLDEIERLIKEAVHA